MSIILKALKRIQEQKEEPKPRPLGTGPEKSSEPSGAAVSPVAPARMDRKKPADAGAFQVRTTRAGRGPSIAPQAGVERHRFGTAPKALLGLIVVLGVFTTGWFVSTIYSNLKLAANTGEAGPQAVNVSQPMPPESQPVAAVPSQAPAPVPVETAAASAVIETAAAAVESPPPATPEPKEEPSEDIVSRAKPVEPEPAVHVEKEAKPIKKGRPELKINAIAWRRKEPRAIVNKQPVYVGDVIEGATVLAIQKGRVLLEYDGEPFEVRF